MYEDKMNGFRINVALTTFCLNTRAMRRPRFSPNEIVVEGSYRDAMPFKPVIINKSFGNS
ncbi:hypothetical protein LXL04_020573 [Taraxacum kok-saghyz]